MFSMHQPHFRECCVSMKAPAGEQGITALGVDLRREDDEAFSRDIHDGISLIHEILSNDKDNNKYSSRREHHHILKLSRSEGHHRCSRNVM